MNVESYEKILRDRQRELYRRLHKIEADFEEPRNPDDEDRATERSNDEVLDELGQVGQDELRAIDAALDRIASGTFGTSSLLQADFGGSAEGGALYAVLPGMRCGVVRAGESVTGFLLPAGEKVA